MPESAWNFHCTYCDHTGQRSPYHCVNNTDTHCLPYAFDSVHHPFWSPDSIHRRQAYSLTDEAPASHTTLHSTVEMVERYPLHCRFQCLCKHRAMNSAWWRLQRPDDKHWVFSRCPYSISFFAKWCVSAIWGPTQTFLAFFDTKSPQSLWKQNKENRLLLWMCWLHTFCYNSHTFPGIAPSVRTDEVQQVIDVGHC